MGFCHSFVRETNIHEEKGKEAVKRAKTRKSHPPLIPDNPDASSKGGFPVRWFQTGLGRQNTSGDVYKNENASKNVLFPSRKTMKTSPIIGSASSPMVDTPRLSGDKLPLLPISTGSSTFLDDKLNEEDEEEYAQTPADRDLKHLEARGGLGFNLRATAEALDTSRPATVGPPVATRDRRPVPKHNLTEPGDLYTLHNRPHAPAPAPAPGPSNLRAHHGGSTRHRREISYADHTIQGMSDEEAYELMMKRSMEGK